jgi:hypothetical protein
MNEQALFHTNAKAEAFDRARYLLNEREGKK